jgi:hypothetical protein
MQINPVFQRVVLAVLLGVVCGCSNNPDTSAAATVTPPAHSTAWPAFVNEFVESTFKAQPFSAAQAGRHEFDGKMPDWSAAGISAEIARLRATRTAALAFDLAALDDAQRFERDYLVSTIDGDLFWLTKDESPFRNPAWYVNRLDPELYLSRQYAPLQQRMSAYIDYARSLPAVAANIRTNLRTPMPKSFVEYGVRAFGGFAEFFAQDVPGVFVTVKDASLQQQLATANGAAVTAMRELRDWFIAQRKTANDSYALGPDMFAAMVRETEGLAVPVAEIEAAGKADLERNTVALKAACAAFAPGKTLAFCVEKVSARKSPGGPVAGARAQLASLRAFIVQKGIVTIPGTEQAQVEESPPYNRQNSAYINIPGPFEKNVASVYNISPPDPSLTPRQQADYVDGEAELLNTTVHEVWPGHFLQYLHANRSQSVIGRLWVGYAYAEGWAHYSEQLMWDMGLADGNPEQHIAQLLDALWRDVRLLSAIGLHTKGMTVAESERLFRERSFSDEGNSRQQAARGTYDPGYLNYTLGKLMIMKLRDDWVAKQLAATPGADPKTQWRAFHDQFLSYGGPPIPLVRRAMVGEGGALL